MNAHGSYDHGRSRAHGRSRTFTRPRKKRTRVLTRSREVSPAPTSARKSARGYSRTLAKCDNECSRAIVRSRGGHGRSREIRSWVVTVSQQTLACSRDLVRSCGRSRELTNARGRRARGCSWALTAAHALSRLLTKVLATSRERSRGTPESNSKALTDVTKIFCGL